MFPGKTFMVYDTEKHFTLEAHRIIYAFLKAIWMVEVSRLIYDKMNDFKERVLFIKTRMAERWIRSKTKVELFIYRWDQLVFQIIS